MTTPAKRRLMRDFKRLQTDPPTGISGAPAVDNIMNWSHASSLRCLCFRACPPSPEMQSCASFSMPAFTGSSPGGSHGEVGRCSVPRHRRVLWQVGRSKSHPSTPLTPPPPSSRSAVIFGPDDTPWEGGRPPRPTLWTPQLELLQLVNARILKGDGLHLPPWRRPRGK